MTLDEFKNDVLNGKAGYEGIAVCDLCGHDISGRGDDQLFILKIEDASDFWEPRTVLHKQLCKRCNEVVQAFMASITR